MRQRVQDILGKIVMDATETMISDFLIGNIQMDIIRNVLSGIKRNNLHLNDIIPLTDFLSKN